jgi:hypothetical protein
MDQVVAHVVELIVRFLVQIAVVVVAFGLVALPVSLMFAPTRAAIARWFGGRRRTELDQGDVLEQLTAANGQLLALRSEVHALRCEVSSSQGLTGAPKQGSLSPSTPGDVT